MRFSWHRHHTKLTFHQGMTLEPLIFRASCRLAPFPDPFQRLSKRDRLPAMPLNSLHAVADQQHQPSDDPQSEGDEQELHALAHVMQLGLQHDGLGMNLPQH